MSTTIYAGTLCATHVNDAIAHPDLDPRKRWWIAEIRHSERYPGPMVIAMAFETVERESSRGSLPKTVKVLKLECDDIVTVGRR